jgi:RHS repeat-associated protein
VAKAVGGTTPSTTVYVSKTAGLPNSPYAGHELAEYTLGAAAANPIRKYAFGRYIDDVLMLVDRTSDGPIAAGNDEKLFCNTDRRFSVTALTNLAGGVVERYAYSPYGEIAVFDGAGVLRTDGTSSYGLSVAYTGRKLDRESGLYFFRARYHDPRLGRFTTRDPLFYPDGPNAYAGWFGVKDQDPEGLYLGFGYGRWCGWIEAGPDLPIDALDYACRAHDFCLATVWEFLIPCNRRLCDTDLCIAATHEYLYGCNDSPNRERCLDAAFKISLLMCSVGTIPLPFPITSLW